MSATWRHILGWTLAALVALALLAAGAAWWLLGTESGARWVVSRAVSAAPGALRIQQVNGSLWGPLALQALTYEDSLVHVSVGKVVLSWRPTQILGGRVAIDELAIEDLGIELKPSPGGSGAKEERAEAVLPDLRLPLDLRISDLRIQPLWLRLPESPDSLVIDRIALHEIALEDSLGIRSLVIESALGDVVLHGAVLTRGKYPLDLDLAWTLRPPEYREVTGRGSLSGSLEKLLVRQEISEPFSIQMEAQLSDLARTPRFDCVIDILDLQSTALDPALPPVRIRGVVNARGEIDSLASDGKLHLDSADYGGWDANFKLRKDGDLWQLLDLTAGMPGDSLRIQARGEVNQGRKPMSMRLVADWRKLRWPLLGETVAGSDRGHARIGGTPAAYQFAVDAGLSLPDAPPSQWQLSGNGTADGIELDDFQGEILDGRIHGAGSVAWAPQIRWDVSAAGESVDPGAYLPDYPGEVSFEIRTFGKMESEKLEGEVHLVSLGGQILERPLSGAGSFDFRGEQMNISELVLGYGGAVFTASGDILAPWDLQWKLEVPDLSIVAPEFEGSLAGQGMLVGPDSLPRIQASIAGDSIAFGVGAIRHLGLDTDITPTAEGDLDLDLAVSGIRFIQGAGFDSILVTSRGTSSRHTVNVDFHVDTDTMRVGFEGQFSDSAWIGAIERLHLRSAEAGVWDLEDPAPLYLSPSRSELEGFCWTSGESKKICLSGFWDSMTGWEFESRLNELGLAVLDRLFPEAARFDVRLNGHATASGDSRGLKMADLEIQSQPGSIHWISGGRDVFLDLDPGLLVVEADSQKADATFRLGVGGGTVEANVRIPRLAAAGGEDGTPLEGDVKIVMPDLSAVEGISPEMGSLQGSLTAELQIGGTTAAPEIGGRAQLSDGKVGIPRLGIEVDDISIQARSEKGYRWEVDGDMSSGPGRVSITAEADLSGGTDRSSLLRLKGDRFEVVNTLDSRVLVSPDLQIRVSGKRLDVDGDVVIPQADIVATKAELATAVPVSPDVVFTDTSRVQAPPPVDVYARVRIVLGEQVRFRGFGLQARPKGQIVAIERPGAPTLGDGELALTEGTYTGYGRELKIDRGRIIYHNSPIDNPELDIRTSRRADDGTIAGFEIRGTLTSPELTVFSEPHRTQEDALSYILYGRPLNDASNQEANLAQQTAALLTMQAGSQLTQGVASSLGIEEARIESEGTMKEASLMLGTHLSPKLYVAYGIGLFEAVNSFRVKYFLGKRWTVQAESGRQTSADLIFSIEK